LVHTILLGTNMKFFFALLALANATYNNNTSSYVKIQWHGAAKVGNVAAGSLTCANAVTGVNLMRVLHWTAASANIFHLSAQGGCLNYKDADLKRDFGATFDKSLAIVHSPSVSGLIYPILFTSTNCVAGGATGGGTNLTGWLTSGANTVCGGKIDGTTTQGVELSLANADEGWEMSATLFENKRHMAFTYIGPYNDLDCKTLSTSTGNYAYPIVVPLEEATATTPADTETAINTTGLCYNHGFAGTDDNHFLFRVRTTATKGQLVITASAGAGSRYSTRINCTDGSTVKSTTFSVGERGNVASCVRASTVDGGDPATSPASEWYKLIPSTESIGDFPNLVDLPTLTPTACPTSSAVHISTTIAALVALIAIAL